MDWPLGIAEGLSLGEVVLAAIVSPLFDGEVVTGCLVGFVLGFAVGN